MLHCLISQIKCKPANISFAPRKYVNGILCIFSYVYNSNFIIQFSTPYWQFLLWYTPKLWNLISSTLEFSFFRAIFIQFSLLSFNISSNQAIFQRFFFFIMSMELKCWKLSCHLIHWLPTKCDTCSQFLLTRGIFLLCFFSLFATNANKKQQKNKRKAKEKNVIKMIGVVSWKQTSLDDKNGIRVEIIYTLRTWIG